MSIPLLLFLFIGVATPNQICNITLSSWQEIAPLPGFHVLGSSAVISNKFYVYAGFNSAERTIGGKTHVWDPSTNTWSEKAPIPATVHHLNGATDGTRYFYCAGGFAGDRYPGVITDRVWSYDALEDRWTELPSLPRPRSAGGVALTGTTLHYVSGLRDRENDSSIHWILNLDNINAGWKNSDHSFPDPRNHFQAVTVNGVIYACEGEFGHYNDPVDTRLIHAFDGSSSGWKKKKDAITPRSHAEGTTIVVYDSIVIMGGRNNFLPYQQQVIDKVDVYYPDRDTWVNLRDLPRSSFAGKAGFLKGVSIAGISQQEGDFIIFSGGGTRNTQPRKDSYVAKVTRNCITVEDEKEPEPTEPTIVTTGSSSTGGQSSTTDDGESSTGGDTTSTTGNTEDVTSAPPTDHEPATEDEESNDTEDTAPTDNDEEIPDTSQNNTEEETSTQEDTNDTNTESSQVSTTSNPPAAANNISTLSIPILLVVTLASILTQF